MSILFLSSQETRVRGAHEEMRPGFPVPRLPEDLPTVLRPRVRHRRHDVQQRVFPRDRELPQQESRHEKVSRRVRPADRGAEKLSLLSSIEILSYEIR